MKGADGFVQAYNAQAIVDADSQVIVAQELSDRSTDVMLLGDMVGQIKTNIGRQAMELSADAGYDSEGNLAILAKRQMGAHIATGKQRHGRSRIEGGGSRHEPKRCAGASPVGDIAAATTCASRRSNRSLVKSSTLEASASSCCGAWRRPVANGA